MEKRMKRRPGLAALFWRYLLTTGSYRIITAGPFLTQAGNCGAPGRRASAAWNTPGRP